MAIIKTTLVSNDKACKVYVDSEGNKTYQFTESQLEDIVDDAISFGYDGHILDWTPEEMEAKVFFEKLRTEQKLT